MKSNEGLYFTCLLPLLYAAKENNFVIKDSQTALPEAWSDSNLVMLGGLFLFFFLKERGG